MKLEKPHLICLLIWLDVGGGNNFFNGARSKWARPQLFVLRYRLRTENTKAARKWKFAEVWSVFCFVCTTTAPVKSNITLEIKFIDCRQ